MDELTLQFEKRKTDHIQISMDPRSQAGGFSLLDQVQIIPEAIPDFNFDEVSLETQTLNHTFSAPFFISSMTAGHKDSLLVNQKLAALSERKNILMGVGSQRRELTDADALKEWANIRRSSPKAKLVGNLGISQLIQFGPEAVQKLADQLQACAFFIHVNALQECLQKEGTPNFRGSWKTLEVLCQKLNVPVVVKEVGCGFSQKTLERLKSIGVYAVDVAGLGGTHWGRVETLRFSQDQSGFKIGQQFDNWGISTLESLLNAKKANVNYQIWASGGIRSGVDIFKCLSLNAKLVGLAQPWMQAFSAQPKSLGIQSSSAVDHDENLNQVYDRLAQELRIAMFCAGTINVNDINLEKVKIHEDFK
jgi:isopentenyl-diphosphate delta-isomerase